MKRYDMKRKLAAALALAMLSGCMPFAALAEEEATPSEPKTRTVETENKFTSVSAGGKNASSKTERDGAVTGSVSYSGETIAVIKLYTAAGDWVGEKEVGNGGGSYSFTGLAAGEYRVDFCLYNQGVKDTSTVTVGYEETAPEPPAPPKTEFTSVSAGGKNASSKTALDGEINGSVSYTGETIAVVKLYTAAGDWVSEKEVGNGGGSYSFTGLAAGEYRVDFCLYNEGVKDSTTVTVGYEETPPTPPTPTEKTMTVDGFTVTNVSAEGKTDGRISGSVSYTGDSAVVVKLYAASDTSSSLQECEIHNGGGSFKFENLAAGKYRVDFHFYNEPAAKSETADVGTEKPPVAKIAISSVAGGENKLTVKGTAQPDTQILVSAEPATAKAEVLTVGSDGAFSASLVAEPGTYTRVTAYYVTDAA